MKKIKGLGGRVPPPTATDIPSRANSICGLTGSHAVPQRLPGRENINSRGIKWLPICEGPVLIRLLILGSSLVVELSLSIKLSTKGHRSSWRGEGVWLQGWGWQCGDGGFKSTVHADPRGTWSRCLSADVLPLMKTMFIVEEVPDSVFTQQMDS